MSETNNGSRRTLIVAPKKAELISGPGDYNSQVLLQDALSILQSEIVNMKAKVMKGQKLDLSEARVLTSYIKSLTDIMKEQRERESEMDLANMSDSELLQLVENLRKSKEQK